MTQFKGKVHAVLVLKTALDDEDMAKVSALIEEVARLREENGDLRRWICDARRNVIGALNAALPPEETTDAASPMMKGSR